MFRHRLAQPIFVLPLSLIVGAAACGHRPSVEPKAALAPIATDSEVRMAAAVITPDIVLQRIGVIADDSMRGRNTPSRGLDLTAQYLAAHYREWGFTPLGDSGSFIQHYTIERIRPDPDPTQSWVECDQPGETDRITFARWATASGPMTGLPVTGPIKLIAGAVTAADIAPLDLKGMIVVFGETASRMQENRAVRRAIAAKRPAALVMVQDVDPAKFRANVEAVLQSGHARAVVQGLPTTGILEVTMHDSAFAGMSNLPDLPAMRLSADPIILDAPPEFRMTIVVHRSVVSTATAPNVVALMEGSDSVLKHEYVIFSGHMDHVGTAGDGVGGCTAKGADSICNGADDDGSGTTGLLSIANAVARLHGRTARSIIILNVSGEEKGLLGSAWFVSHPPPSVPLGQVVADLNFDMIGRNNPDSIVVIGKEHSDLGATLAGIQAAHPELGLTAADDIWPEERFYSRSDHFNFARKGIPVLFFFNGIHPQYHRPDDEIRLIEPGKLARVAQLGFYLGVAIADAPARPQWNPASYQTIVVEQRAP